MNVLVVTSVFPLPRDSGGPVRFVGLARALAADYDIHLLAVRRPDTTDRLVSELESVLQAPVEVFDRPPSAPDGALGVLGRWVRATARGVPPWVSHHFSRELARRAEALAPKADAVVVLEEYAGAYVTGLAPLAPVVCDKSNVQGWSAAADRAVEGVRERVRRSLSISLIRRFEGRYVRNAAAVVVTSAEEGRRLEALYGRPPDAVVHSAVDLPPELVELGGSRTVGWLGTHEYSANVEGLVKFVEEAWEPLGRDGMRLLIAGRCPPPRVQDLERFPGVTVLGYVEDLGEFFDGLGAAVVPLWRGAGVKIKTLAFMAAGVPVAGTPVALEGVEADDGHHCAIAHDPTGLAEALRSLLDDVEGSRRMAAQARSLIAERYTWRTVGPEFSEVVRRAARASSVRS